MAKKEVKDKIVEIKKLLGKKGLIIGTERTLKNLKQGRLNRVYLASNCSEKVKDEIMHLSKIARVSVVELEYPNDELGVICKRPYSISVLSVAKE
jgi:large subunit ribosomal protein L30e